MANVDSIYEVGSTVFLILGSLTFLLTYLRGAVNKSNRDVDQNTITSLKENIDATSRDRDQWKERALTAEGANKVLTDTVTSAPQIAKLAKVTAQQHKESMDLQKTIIKELKSFIEIAGKRSR